MDLVDILIEEKKETEKYFKDPLFWAEKIKGKAREFLPDARVYLFGSIVKGNYLPSSDIDVLVVSEALDETRRSEIRDSLFKAVGFFSPFEIHLVTKEQFEGWYKRFLKNDFVEV